MVFPQGALFARSGELYTIAAYFAQIDALRAYFDRVTLCVRVEKGPGGDCRLHGVDVVGMPPYTGRVDLIRRVPDYRRRMRAALRDADLALVVLPGYLGALASHAARSEGVRRVHFVVGRWGRVVISRRAGVVGRLWARLISPILDHTVANLTRDSLTFFNGAVPPNPPAHHHLRVSSTFSATDIRTAGGQPRRGSEVRLLWAGRLSVEKGLPNLLHAVALLRANGVLTVLDVVGEGEERVNLEREAARLGLGEAVRFRGWLPRGEALWKRFDSSHVLVLPSLEDMAPRVVLEAMARGIPVVATAVGNIPSYVRNEDTGLLITPGSASAISNAVRRLVDEPELRLRLIERGVSLAERHTLEAETARTVSIINDHFSSGRETRS